MNARDESYFMFTFLAHLTHDYFNNAGHADRPVHDLFDKLFKNNMMKNTVILFFADHGLRFGPIRRTHSGEIEARLPFMFIYLPETMETYKHIMEQNQYRLVTPFDIDATMFHIVEG